MANKIICVELIETRIINLHMTVGYKISVLGAVILSLNFDRVITNGG